MASFEKPDGVVRTKRKWLQLATMLLAGVGLIPVIFVLLHATHGGHWGYWVIVVAYYTTLFGSTWLTNRWWHVARGLVRADANALRVDEQMVVRREAIRNGYILERDGKWLVRLDRLFRRVDIEVNDAAEGEALLAAMRLDAGHSVAKFTMTHGTLRGALIRIFAAVTLMSTVGPAALVALLFATHSLALSLGAMLAIMAAFYAYVVNLWLRVAIGADGLRIRSLLGRSRFIPFTSIAGATMDGSNISVALSDGGVVRMHHPGGQGGKWLLRWADRLHDGNKLVERINERVATRRARTDADAPIFARAGRETEVWLREVVIAADVNASYRSPAVPPDELWRIVEDTAASATARAGAAVALRAALDESGRARLGVVADACAAPRLRIALETVASTEGDDDRLRGALDPLDDDEPSRQALALPTK